MPEYDYYNGEFREELELVSLSGIATEPHEMVKRPFELFNEKDRRGNLIRSYSDEIDIGAIVEGLDMSPTREIGTSYISKHIGKALRPSDRGHEIFIPNGWDERRISYILVVRTPRTSGYLYTYIQGYTDKYDVDHKFKELADDTIFYMNRITLISEVEDDYGNIHHNHISSLEIVYDDYNNSQHWKDEMSDGFNRTSRASDINIEMTARSLYANNNISNTANRLQGTTGKINKVSQRTGAGLLSEVINKYSSVMDGVSGIDTNTMLTTNSLLSSVDSKTIPFIAALDILRDEVRTGISTAPSSFTYEELRILMPEVGDDDTLIVEPDELYDDMYTTDEDSMADDSEATVIVTDLMNFVMESMSKYAIRSTGFLMHNLNGDGNDIVIEYTHMTTYTIPGLNKDIKAKRLSAFLRDIRDMFLLPLIENGERGMFISVYINSDFEGKILIEGDGIEKRQYPITTSVSSLTSPVITNDRGFNTLTNGIENIVKQL